MRSALTRASENKAWESMFCGGCLLVCSFICFPLQDESFYLASAFRHREAHLLSQHQLVHRPAVAVGSLTGFPTYHDSSPGDGGGLQGPLASVPLSRVESRL